MQEKRAGTSILLIDDIPIFRDLATVALAPLARVVSASDDETGLALLRSHAPSLTCR